MKHHDATCDALVSAGRARFRAIFLTTLTTIVGLSPLILEKSFHAQFIVTMAVSVAAGLVSATILILLVLPCMIMALDDVRRGFARLWNGGVEWPEHVERLREQEQEAKAESG